MRCVIVGPFEAFTLRVGRGPWACRYLTTIFTTVAWLVVPDVAIMVRAYAPAGVDCRNVEELAQPARATAEADMASSASDTKILRLRRRTRPAAHKTIPANGIHKTLARTDLNGDERTPAL